MRSMGFANDVEMLASEGLNVQGAGSGEGNVLTFRFQWEEQSRAAAKEPMLELRWSIPVVGLHFMWHPAAGSSRKLRVDWMGDIATMTAVSAPVMSFYSEDGVNACTIALSETQKEVRWNMGVHEEDGTLLCRIRIPLDTFTGRESYTVSLWRDRSPVRYETAIGRVTRWWEEDCGLRPMPVPEAGRMPMYSTWYSLHQDITDSKIEEDCALAAELGLESVLVDDGWQTDDNSRGYAFCGDWQVASSKIPDMAAHVERVHRLGLKYLVWFSVPFVGRKSAAWPRFEDKLLWYDERLEAGVLDPRYPEVRAYLKETYLSRVAEWNIDGLKLDFIDQFYARPQSAKPKEGMDFCCVQEAVDVMMTGITDALRQRNPDFLIEFRQGYVGPNMRKYGNLFRVGDCPDDLISNRVGMVDLRLLSGSSAVHSDMLMWHPEESCENAAIQLENVLFATLQLSVRPGLLTEAQREMVCFWIRFMKEHCALLQQVPIHALYPQMLYPLVWTAESGEAIYALYAAELAVEPEEGLSRIIIVNANHGSELLLRLREPGTFRVTVQDCRGRLVSSGEQVLQGLCAMEVPAGGLVTLER
ncbi:MAG: alpha-galactosidase [Oscillospiraceae bacterium]|nr:alpha-galactosidase [Oscillospiraceae bacterium]